jgi:uncharacterized protein (DUF302 family)
MASSVLQTTGSRSLVVINVADGVTRLIPESFDKSVLLIRRLLSTAGFSIVEEFDVSKEMHFQSGNSNRCCTVLLVDTPVLFFEAIVLDRSAAVFLPLHVVVSGDREASCVHCVNPMTSSGLRPPEPAKGALEVLYKRVTEALSELPDSAEMRLQGQAR